MNSQKVELIIKSFLLNILVFLAQEIFQLHTATWCGTSFYNISSRISDNMLSRPVNKIPAIYKLCVL